MDTAVALTQSYLYMNGYFTVTEYPVFELLEGGDVRTVTDIDVLAVRFPGAGRRDASDDARGIALEPDPALDVDPERIDLIIGEVKEGRAELNDAAMQPEVVHAALHRFGHIDVAEAAACVAELLSSGDTLHPDGSARIRLMAFGSRPPRVEAVPYGWMLMGHMTSHMRRVLIQNWTAARAIQSKDPVLSMMILQEKALRGEG